jgi:hypothetical protein
MAGTIATITNEPNQPDYEAMHLVFTSGSEQIQWKKLEFPKPQKLLKSRDLDLDLQK